MNPFKILFVCTGNTCRSAMAAAIMNDIAVKNNLNVLIESAGVFAAEGDTATDNAIAALAGMGIDLSGHRSKRITSELVEMADAVLVMTSGHKMLLNEIAKDKVYTLLEYAGLSGDISDPYGGDDEVYRKTADEIHSTLLSIAERLK